MDSFSIDADRAAVEASAAAAAALLAPPELAPLGIEPAGGQLAPQAPVAQLEQTLVGACVAAIRRALPAPQQLDLGAIVQALNSGLESGGTLATFTSATDDIVVELQRLAEAVDTLPPAQAAGRLETMADFIQKNLPDIAAQVRRLEEQLKDVRDRQEELLVGQKEAAASQRVAFDRCSPLRLPLLTMQERIHLSATRATTERSPLLPVVYFSGFIQSERVLMFLHPN
jgi:hypothetical protein